MNRKSKGQLEERLLQSDNQSNSVTVSHMFKIQPQELKDLFDPRFDFERSIIKYNQQGGVDSLIKKLATDVNVGIVGDEKDLQRRKNIFGANNKPLPTRASLWQSIKQECTNIIWPIIAVTALFAGLCGLFTDNAIASIAEAVSIIGFAFGIIVISSAADWLKDKRFVELQSLTKDENMTVIRGKEHQTMSVNVWHLVVGDIVLLETGQRVPGDCLVIKSSNMTVDESPEDEEIQQKQKGPFSGRSGDPFLKADSLIIKGNATALVCAVGESSTRGKYMKGLEDEININTALQEKLKNLGNQLTKYAILSSFVIFVILVTVTIIETVYGDEKEDKNAATIIFKKIPMHVSLIAVLVIVAIPEALPLTVGVSLAFSVMKMYKDGILIRKLDAPERLAGAEEICCGKTATLTQNEMKVKYFYLEGQQIKNSRKDTFMHCELNPETIELVKDSIFYNSSALVEMKEQKNSKNSQFTPTGNGTDVGLLKFLQDSDIRIDEIVKTRLANVVATLPFSSENKFSVVAVKHPAKPGQIALYIKGAPEIILEMCPHALSQNGIIPIQQVIHQEGANSSTYRQDFEQKYISLASQPHRMIAFAYAELHQQDWDQMEQQFESPSYCLTELVQTGRIQFNLIGAFALRDKIRSGVRQAVTFARDQAGINVRLISGDHIDTAEAVAINVGIIKEEERGGTYTVMHANEFERVIGGFDHNEQIVDMEKFNEIIQDLRVLARAKPEHKHMIVAGLKELSRTVVVTGDGINDVKSIQIADVGLAMGSGCSAAKEVSDIILVGDDFHATVTAIKWGRNIYHNVGRFLQFQITVNLSVLLTIAICSPILAESPISAVQLLWVNLIMDTFAAFALATEEPLDSVLSGPPFQAEDNVLTPVIWRQILGITFWNVMVMLFICIFGPVIAGLEYTYSTTANQKGSEAGLAKLKHVTIMFNTFIFLQIFNEINCRKIDRRDFNVFEGIHRNLYFIAVVLGTFFGQFVLTHYFPGLTRTTSLTKQEWGGCIFVGATPLAISALLKLTPESWTERIKVDKIIDENKSSNQGGVLAAYNKSKNIKATDFVKKKGTQDGEDDDFVNVK